MKPMKSSQLNVCRRISPSGNILCVAILLLSLLFVADAKPTSGRFGAGDGEPSSGDWATLRLRRHVAALEHQQPPSELQQLSSDNQFEQQQQQQDERMFIRRQLPDLIAQAHNDRLAERKLFKLLIDASLRYGLGNVVATAQQQAQQQVSGRPLLGREQLAALDEQLAAEQPAPARLARFEQIIDPQWASSADQDGGPFGPAPLQQTLLDKREYSKPCSFNAISCVRTPFRKL